MNYEKHYKALINRSIERECPEISEKHHIIPRCLGGRDRNDNLVSLTPEEHLIAHLLLVKMFPKNPGLVLAAVMMSRDNRNGKRANNKMYGWLRKKAYEAQSLSMTGKKHSEETKRKISNVLKESDAVKRAAKERIGVARTDEVKNKLSDSHKKSVKAIKAREELSKRKIGRAVKESTKAKISAAFLGKNITDEHKEKISKSLKGKSKTDLHNANVSKALKGNKNALGAVRSEETREKMRQAKLGTKMSDEAVKKMVDNKTPEQRRNAALKAWETKRAKNKVEA